MAALLCGGSATRIDVPRLLGPSVASNVRVHNREERRELARGTWRDMERGCDLRQQTGQNESVDPEDEGPDRQDQQVDGTQDVPVADRRVGRSARDA